MPNGSGEWSKLSWAEWKGAIGSQVNTIRENQDQIFKILNKLQSQVAFIQGRSAALGAAGGGTVGAIWFLVKYINEKG